MAYSELTTESRLVYREVSGEKAVEIRIETEPDEREMQPPIPPEEVGVVAKEEIDYFSSLFDELEEVGATGSPSLVVSLPSDGEGWSSLPSDDTPFSNYELAIQRES